MAYYDSEDFTQMQRDALRRMEEMQRRAKISPAHAPLKPPEQSPPVKSNISTRSYASETLPLNLNGLLNIDPEKLLILIMLFILYKNKADPKLLLALGYLLI